MRRQLSNETQRSALHVCSARRVGYLATSLCLVLSLTACSTEPKVLLRPDPAPASLTAPCDEGPEPPQADAEFRLVERVVSEREQAAEECRLKHFKLS